LKLVWPQGRSISTSDTLFAEQKKKTKEKKVTIQKRMSAYTAFITSTGKFKSALEQKPFSEASKELSSEWRNLSDAEKREYQDIADKTNSSKSKPAKTKTTSPYNRFVAATYPEEKSKHDGKTTDVLRAVAARWKALSDSEKASY